MSAYNVTALAGRLLRDDVAANAPIDDQSLNAGIEPLEAELDNRVIEVVAPLQLIEQQLKSNAIEIGDEVTPVAEALLADYQGLAYLRQDMKQAKGMSQRLAQEAIALKPSFGRNRPVNHYSSIPTKTYYQTSLEELDLDLKGKVLNYLAVVHESIAQAQRSIKGSAIDCQDRYGILSNAMSSFTKQFISLEDTVRAVGLNWNEKDFVAEQTKHCPADLVSDLSINPFIRSMVDRGDYFFTMCYARYITEAGRTVMDNWVDVLDALVDAGDKVEAAKAIEPVKSADKVTVYGNKVIKLDTAEQFLYSLSVKGQDKALEPIPFKLVLSGLAASMAENELPSTIVELQQCYDGLERIRVAVNALIDKLQVHSVFDDYADIVQGYATDLLQFTEGFGRGTLGRITEYVSNWNARAEQAIAYGMYMVEGADCMVKVYAPAELQTGEDLRNQWRDQVDGLRNAAAVILVE